MICRWTRYVWILISRNTNYSIFSYFIFFLLKAFNTHKNVVFFSLASHTSPYAPLPNFYYIWKSSSVNFFGFIYFAYLILLSYAISRMQLVGLWSTFLRNLSYPDLVISSCDAFLMTGGGVIYFYSILAVSMVFLLSLWEFSYFYFIDSRIFVFSVKMAWFEFWERVFCNIPISIDFHTYYFLRISGLRNLIIGSGTEDDKSTQLLLLSELNVLSRSELLERLLFKFRGE